MPVCPLLALSPDSGSAICLKEDCAWWDGVKGLCAVHGLFDISEALEEIEQALARWQGRGRGAGIQ